VLEKPLARANLSNPDLIAQDAQDTLHNLINLSTEVIFSYAKVHLSGEQQPSPLLTFNHETPALTHNYQNTVLETVDVECLIGVQNH
jgi:hypothetical protein